MTPTPRLVLPATFLAWQPPGEQPLPVDLPPCVRVQTTPGQPYTPPPVTLTEAWQSVDPGWVQTPGVVLVVNEEGRFTQLQPTEAQRQEAQARVVEVGVAFPPSPDTVIACDLVRPGDHRRLEPPDFAGLRLRCRTGTARVSLTIFPA